MRPLKAAAAKSKKAAAALAAAAAASAATIGTTGALNDIKPNVTGMSTNLAATAVKITGGSGTHNGTSIKQEPNMSSHPPPLHPTTQTHHLIHQQQIIKQPNSQVSQSQHSAAATLPVAVAALDPNKIMPVNVSEFSFTFTKFCNVLFFFFLDNPSCTTISTWRT